jgi:uncharacterized protein YfaS (alpha-2-macroglobulin family)
MQQILPAKEAPPDEPRSTGYSWSSATRDEAILLDVLATVDPDHEQIPVILGRLAARAKNGRWHNTQENGFGLLAVGKVLAHGGADPAPGEVRLDGEVVATFDWSDRTGPDAEEPVVVRGEDWQGRKIEVLATGPGSVHYSVVDAGVPRSDPSERVSEGLLVNRSYLDADGNPVDLARVTQGQVIFCRLGLSSSKGTIRDVVISDLVPAGLEIENPRLVGTGQPSWIRTSGPNRVVIMPIEHLDVRDDRLLLFTTARPNQEVYFYGLRAVTAGTFVHPPVRAEAMYDPDVRCVTRTAEVTVEAP